MSPSTFLIVLFAPVLALISITPDPIALQIGGLPLYWYGVCYAVGLAATYFVITREARRRGLNARLVDNGIIVVGIAALAGGRMYHVIDQWQLYQDNLIGIILPPYSGLGVYGGIFTGVLVAWVLIRFWRQPFWRWADVIAPGLFVMQAIGRWGNFFNQELYGPPTDLPWGIAIDCAHRVARLPVQHVPARSPPGSTRCSCTSRSAGFSERSPCSGSRVGTGGGCGPATCSSSSSSGMPRCALAWRPCGRATGRSSVSRPRCWCRSW